MIPILFEDEHFFAIDKPQGYFVHPPEASAYPVAREKICLHVLSKQFGRGVYPVHRLDAPTSGVVLFAKSKNSTRILSRLFAEREIKKTYHAVARGFLDLQGEINIPLEIKGFETLMESKTHYRRLAQIELPFAIGTKYPTARYSLVEVEPHTGRWHQIRRHFDRISHPLIGDIEHGDSHHNRFFRDQLKIPGLCLHAKALEFIHPWTQKNMMLEAPVCDRWRRIYALFQAIPMATD
jgi:tRNA pseudouridine65 synthase